MFRVLTRSAASFSVFVEHYVNPCQVVMLNKLRCHAHFEFSANQIFWSRLLTLVLLNRIYPTFANSVDPDQLASEEANWSGSALIAIKYVNL